MDLLLKGKSAIVTGGPAGIGLAIVKALLAGAPNVEKLASRPRPLDLHALA
ncbi:MAG TPA: hypothetical protein VHY37_02270 [Tepidisphaeraceae bacterium]|jgi:NAD(P)-dependent dehydrogenase (short-subunit alcohol dehydrogenase family)|nr:hypothetical protein [Tepidisphaeraceae bacterium]